MCRCVFFDVVDEEEDERYHRHVIRRVGQARADTPVSRPTWYGYFLEAAVEQYEESLTQAREYLTRNFPGHQEWHIEGQAYAYRTLAIRDVLLYLKFRLLPPLAGSYRRAIECRAVGSTLPRTSEEGCF